jgi:type I restriction enzyme S subunit
MIKNDKTNWQTKNFDDCLDKVVYTNKIQRKDFLKSGLFPIISQESEDINGYWDDEKDLSKCKKPVVIFGDHTQVLKYVDFDFVLGADGVKILQPKEILDSRFFYFFLQNIDLKSLGYARHFRLLKEIDVSFPPLPEQHRIVKILDEVFADVAKAKENAEKNLQNAKELFESYLQSVFVPPSLKLRTGKEFQRKDWEEKRLGDVCDTGAGGTPLKAHKDYYENGNIPWLRSGEVCKKDITESELFITEKGLNNSSARKFPINTVLVAMYGATAGQTGILRFESTTNQAVCGILPNENFIPEYIYYIFSAKKKELVDQAVGGAQPNISQIKIKDTYIPVLSLTEQKSIVAKLDALSAETKKLEVIYRQKLADLEELKKSVLKSAFAGKY